MSLFFRDDAFVAAGGLYAVPNLLLEMQVKLVESPLSRVLLFAPEARNWSEPQPLPSQSVRMPLPVGAGTEEKRIYMVRILAICNRSHPAVDSEAAVESDRRWANLWQLRRYPDTRITDYTNLLFRLVGQPKGDRVLRLSPQDTYRWGGVIRQYIYASVEKSQLAAPLSRFNVASHYVGLTAERIAAFRALLEYFTQRVDEVSSPSDAFPTAPLTTLTRGDGYQMSQTLKSLLTKDLQAKHYNMLDLVGTLAGLEHFYHLPLSPLTQDNLVEKMRFHLFNILDRVLESEFRRAFGETLALTHTETT